MFRLSVLSIILLLVACNMKSNIASEDNITKEIAPTCFELNNWLDLEKRRVPIFIDGQCELYVMYKKNGTVPIPCTNNVGDRPTNNGAKYCNFVIKIEKNKGSRKMFMTIEQYAEDLQYVGTFKRSLLW